jgi:hypothetical protein
VCVLGGCVTACLQSIDESISKQNTETDFFTNISEFRNGDIGKKKKRFKQ